MDKGQIAKENFLSGINCAQAVVLAFSEEMELSKEQLMHLSIGFGGGFGRLRLVCGAVSGMTMVLSKILSDGKDRSSIYPVIQEACRLFKEQTGSLICAEMLDGVVVNDGSPVPEDRTKEYYKKRPCAELCQLAGEIAQKIIQRERSK